MSTLNDVYTEVTNRIISDLERGQLTWRKPWGGENLAVLPLRSNHEPYSGINTIMLWGTAAQQGYQSPYWMTFKQALALGGSVRKGEKSSPVVYANKMIKDGISEDGETHQTRIPFLKVYRVFNAAQIDGLPDGYYKTPEPRLQNQEQRIEALETFFRQTKAEIITGTEASYSVTRDRIEMPPFECFDEAAAYYATLAHEVTHWTRHPSRLDRRFGRKSWGDEGYAKEELVAELGACFLAADLCFAPKDPLQSAAYIQSWLKAMKNDKKFIFHAAAHAQRAIEYLSQLQKGPAILSTPSVPPNLKP